MADMRVNRARRTASIFTILTAAAFCFMSGTAEGQIRTITGHTDDVNSIAWSPDGTKIVSGSDDNTVKIWNASTGALIHTIDGHTNWVYSVAWSPDGTRIASGSRDGTVKIWNASTGALIRERSHTLSVLWVAWSPDGTKIFSVDNLHDINIWNASNGQLNYKATAAGTIVSVNHNGTKFAGSRLNKIEVWNIPTSGNPSKAYDLSVNNAGEADFNHDGTRLVSGSSGTDAANQKIKIWDLSVSTPTALHTLTHGGQVFNVDFSQDGTMIASGSSENTVKMWNASTGALLKTFTGHTDNVFSVEWSPDGTKIASGSADNSIKIWNAELPHTGDVFSVDYSPDGTRIVSGSGDKTIKIWNAYDITAPIATLRGHTDWVRSVAYNHNGTRIVSGGKDNSVRIWNAATGALIRAITDHTGAVRSVAYNHNGTRIASGSEDDTVKIWSAAGALIRTINHGSNVHAVAFNHDGTRIASGGVGNVRIWNAATGALVHTLTANSAFSVAFNHDGTKLVVADYAASDVVIWDVSVATPSKLHTMTHTGFPFFAAWSPDGSKVASGHLDNVIKMWNASTGTLISTLTGHTDGVGAVDFSPDGTKLVSGSDDDSIRLWDVPEIISSHTDDVNSVAWSPDGTKIVSGSDDNSAIIWNADTGANIRSLTTSGHTDNVNSVAFNHNGTQIASGSADNNVKVWNASTGAVVHTLTDHSGDVTSVAFKPDGTNIISGSKDDSIKDWNASTGGLIGTITYVSENLDVLSVAYSRDGTKLAAGYAGNSLKILNTTSVYYSRLHTLSANTVASVAYNHDGTRLVSGSAGTGAANQTVKIWDMSATTPTALHTLTHGSAVHSVDFSPDGALVASGGANNAIKIWNASTGALIQTIASHTDNVNSVAFSPDGTKLASGSDDNTVRVWKIVLPKDPTSPTDPTDPPVVIDPYRANIESVRFSADSAMLINARRTGYVDIWNVDLTAKRAALSKSLKQGQHWVLDADLSPDGKQIVSAGSITDIQIADAETGLIARTLKGHTDWTTAAAYSPDGSLIASGSKDNTARLWNAKTGALVHTLTGHTGTVDGAVFSSDGSLLATVSEDNTARLYNVSTGALVHTFKGHTGAVHAAAFSPDGKTLATASDDGKARLYNVSTGALLHTLEDHTGAATAVLFSPNGASLITGDEGGARRVWKVSSGELQATYGDSTDPITTGFPTDSDDSAELRHRGSVRALAFAADGKTLISCGSWVDVLVQELDIADPPTATITGPTDAVTGAFDVTITFSEAVTGFEASDITVTNGSVSSLTGSGVSYTAKIAVKALFEGTVTVSIPAGAAQDVDKEGSLAAKFEAAAELGAPTVALTGPDGPLGLSAFEVAIEFNQEVSGLEASDIAVTGGTAAAPTGSGASYTVSITPSADAEKATVSIPAGAVQNAGGEANEASNAYEVAIDGSIPTVAVTGPEGPVGGAPFDLAVEFSEEVSGFDADDVSVEGGSVASVDGSGMSYTVSIDPDDEFEETLTVSIPAGAANDSADNASQASNVYEVEVDQTAPTVSIEGPSGPIGPAPLNLTITFSESVSGFEAEDLAVVGGSATLNGSGMNYTAVVRANADFQGVLTVSIGADAAQDSAGNMSLASEAYSVEIVRSTSFTINLRQGLNLLHAPVNDARLERLSDLYDALGGAEDVLFLMTYSSELNRFVSYVGSGAGSDSDLRLSDETAVLASMNSAKSVTFTGGLLNQEARLRAGLNLVGVTRSGAVETVGDLTALSTVPLRIIALRYDANGAARFMDITDSAEAVNGGEGYFIAARSETVLTFDGGAWKNDAAATAASVEAVVYDPSSTPLLMVEGSIAREDNLTPLNGLEVSITNLQTGQTASDTAGRSAISGRFSLPLLALTGDSYAVGDAFDLRVVDSSGTFGGVRTVRIVLDKETAAAGRIDIGQLLATAIPTESSLLPNYPNPFNPETWIPFELSEESRVTITIYNAAGQTVRTLELGQLPAGAYRSRQKAAYWDGRNALGEPTASGIYYVRIEAGSFTALRRMVVLK